MLFRGKEIDPIRLWSDYCEVKIDDGPFLPLTYCPNPSHNNTRSPAFQINIARPTVHCFSYCGISGSYEWAVCIIEGLFEKYGVDLTKLEAEAKEPGVGPNELKKRKAYREARKIIYRKSVRSFKSSSEPRSREVLSRKRVQDQGSGSGSKKAQQAKEVDLAAYSYLPKEALKYLESRGIDPSSRARWQIGFDEGAKRVTIPVRDERGRLRFIIRRGIYPYQKPPYLYPDESGKSLLLFGACNLDEAMVSSQGLIVVEGPLDCIRLHQHGFINTVSVLGAYVSNKQRELIARLRPKRIILFFDKDGAGVRAIEKAAKQLPMYQIKVPLYPKGERLDPAALSKHEVEIAVREAIPLLRLKKKIRKAKGAVVSN